MVMGTGFAIDCQEVNQAINQFSPRLGPATTPFCTSCRCRIDRYGHNISTRTSFDWLIDVQWRIPLFEKKTFLRSTVYIIAILKTNEKTYKVSSAIHIRSLLWDMFQLGCVKRLKGCCARLFERVQLTFRAADEKFDTLRFGQGGFWSLLWIPHVFWREIRVCLWWRGGKLCRARVLAAPFSSAPFDEGYWFDNLDAAHKQMLLYFQFFVEGKDTK